MSDWFAESIGDDSRGELFDAVNCMVGDSYEHIAQVCFRIDAAEFCGANEAVDGSGTFAA